jgi:hypothetical protein
MYVKALAHFVLIRNLVRIVSCNTSQLPPDPSTLSRVADLPCVAMSKLGLVLSHLDDELIVTPLCCLPRSDFTSKDMTVSSSLLVSLLPNSRAARHVA